MELTLMDNGHTKIEITREKLKTKHNIRYINNLMALYGGKRVWEDNECVYYDIYADAINRRE